MNWLKKIFGSKSSTVKRKPEESRAKESRPSSEKQSLQDALDEVFTIAKEIEEDQVQCLRCLVKNPPGSIQCRNCGAYLDES